MSETMTKEYDLSDLICPLSKIRAMELIENLNEGESARLILGDIDSLKSVAQELKTKGIIPGFKQNGDNRFVLTVSR